MMSVSLSFIADVEMGDLFGVATFVQGTIVQGDSCPRDFCPWSRFDKVKAAPIIFFLTI